MVDKIGQVLATVASALTISVVSSGIAVYVTTEKLDLKQLYLEQRLERYTMKLERLEDKVNAMDKEYYIGRAQ